MPPLRQVRSPCGRSEAVRYTSGVTYTLHDSPSGITRHASPLEPRLTALHQTFLNDRPPGSDEDVHMIAELVDHVIERCSRPGDTVFDPFAGFGTTIARAAALGRRSVGIELLPERVAYLQLRTPEATVIEGDARELSRLVAALPTESVAGGSWPGGSGPDVDLILTSPPYMTAQDHDADPLTAYELDTGDYARYLRELGLVAAQCARAVKPGGYVVWNVADIRHRGRTTPLIRDCERELRRHLVQLETTRIEWDRYPHDLVADALLVFQRPVSAAAEGSRSSR